VPYGYRVDSNGYLEINNDPLPNFDLSEADIIRLIFMMVLENHDSTYKIANHLNALNIPTSYAIHNRQVKRGSNTSGIWRPDRIWNIITNPTYKGIHVYGKESKKERDLITREVPAIIAEHIWDHAQQLLKENRLKAVQDIKYRYFLRGLIRCGACGSTYSGTVYPGPGRENKGYYVCNGKTIYRGPHQKKCSSRNIDQMWIEDFIWGECLSFIESTGKAIEEFRVTVEKYRTSSAVFEKETKILTRSLQKLEAEKHHTLDYYRKGMLSLETITQSLRKIATEKDGYDLRLEEMSEPPPGQAWGLLTV
jgi:site-specific DNA recombinase